MDFDRQSISSMGSRQHAFERPGSDIRKTGYLKKMKYHRSLHHQTMKKKFFVLRSTSSSGPARLEYYDSEKKFKAGQPPKRSILLHTCFNINKKSDSRHGKHGIVLYTNEECFTVLTESEDEQEAWLSIMLEFQNEYLPDGDMHKEHYEHVWQVTLQPKGLGQGKGTKGPYRLCLNTTTLSLVKANSTQPQYAIQLVTIRTVAHNECSFRLEVGKVAPTGEGEFWFAVEDASIAKDMHETLLHYMNTVKDPSLPKDQQPSMDRRWSSKQETKRPASYYPPSTGWPGEINSPSSPNYPSSHDHLQGAHRPRSNTAESRASRASSHSYHDDGECMMVYNGEPQEHISYVPEDMSPPPSPGGLDEEMSAYLQMDMERNRQSGATTASVTPPSAPASYFTMSMPSHGHGQKGEISPSMPEPPTSMGYMSMHPHHPPPTSHMSAPIPIHTHSFSEPHHTTHSTPLPTVREGGSNEGYLPMDIPNSPASSTGVLRPDPAKCMLSDDNTGLPPRTYSLGSKPVTKKYPGYMEMGPRKGAVGNDMSRATSAPHIIHNLKGRREREHATDSPTPSASSLSTSIKSDDSDSFMEYMPMRPRTASDSFNYRPRTSSFGKLQQTCRPRSSSHGQGTRPFTKFSKLSVEQARISQDPLQRTSRESSLHGSFDSLRVSNESLRRMSQEMRQPSGSNASDYAEMRGTPSPQMKKSEADGYVNMQVGPGGRRSSPHRMRTDSSGSGRRPDVASSSSERLHQQSHLQQIDDYTEMAPLHSGGGSSGDSYMNMDYGPGSRHSFSSDTKSLSSTSSLQSSRPTDYMSMDMDSKNKKSDTGRSLSMENVDTYVIHDPSHGGNKPRTGSLGSKDKKISRPGSARKSSSASMSSASPSSSGTIHPSASTSTRTGGSSDSIRKASRQSSMEKYGSLGKDFRKKSGSTGSRPNTKGTFGVALGKEQHVGSGIMPMRKGTNSKTPIDEPTDEYIEFVPTACLGDSDPHIGHSTTSHSAMTISNSGRCGPFASSGSFGTGRSPNPTPSPLDEEDYTPYNPAPTSSSRAVHFQAHQQPQHLPPTSHGHHYHHHHHSPSQAKSGFLPSSHSTQPTSSAQTKQVAAKDVPEYVGFEPGVIPTSSSLPSTSSTSASHVRQVEAKDVPEYVGFEPGNIPSTTTSSTTMAPHARPAPPQDMTEYVGFQPGMVSQQSAPHPSKPVSPNSAFSYIQSSTSSQQSGGHKHKQTGMKPQHSSLDHGSKLMKPDTQSGTGNSSRSPSSNNLSSEIPRRGSSPVPLGRPKSPLGPSVSPHMTTQTAAPKSVELDTSEYLSYNPAVPKLSTNTLKENTEPGPVPTKIVSLIEGSVTQAPQFTQLSVDVGGGGEGQEPCSPQGSGRGNTDSVDGIGDSGGGSRQKQQHKPHSRQQQEPKQPRLQPQTSPGYQRQMSAPTYNSANYGKPTPIFQDSQLQPPSPQPILSSPNIDSHGASRKKHLSGSSVTESPSPTGFGTRQKHWSGSSNSSVKSRRVSSDSEKSTPKGSKSDSNTSLNSTGSKKKSRISSGERSSGSSAEKSPLSPSRGSGDVFCSSSGNLEAKMVPVTAKIRYSLTDMPSVVGVVNKDVQSHHGLSRPGSTPCMQNLDPCPDQGSRSAGDTPSPGSLQFPGGPRSRHSLSDLGSYSPMNVTPSGLATVNAEPSNISTSGTSRNSNGGSNSGSGESCGSGTDLPPKPLNYVRLDLSYPEGQGDADGKSPRGKSRNSSDADEKQPPLSYAEIDFVRSQNFNRALAMGNTGDSNSSKS